MPPRGAGAAIVVPQIVTHASAAIAILIIFLFMSHQPFRAFALTQGKERLNAVSDKVDDAARFVMRIARMSNHVFGIILKNRLSFKTLA